MLTPEIQQQLLTIARLALEARVRRTRAPDPGPRTAAQPKHGAFVTIFCQGELRGCLGRITSEMPLPELMLELIPEEGPRKALFRQVGIRAAEAAKPEEEKKKK